MKSVGFFYDNLKKPTCGQVTRRKPMHLTAWQKNNPHLPKIYSSVFQGRFHAQKGIVELIDIWKMVVDKLPSAKLALIGDGPLMAEVKQKQVLSSIR